jgi:hypothetical protein
MAYDIRPTDDESVDLHHRIDFSDGSKRMWWTLPNGTKGLGGRAVADLPPYGAHEWQPGRPTIHVEGERARDALAPLAEALGYNVVGHVTGAPMTHSADAFRPLLSPMHYLWPDRDDPGETQQARTHDVLRELFEDEQGIPLTRSRDLVRRIAWEDAPAKGDAADWVARGGTAAGLRLLLEDAPPWSVSASAATPDVGAGTSAGIWLSDVEPERVVWLSQGRLARGKTTIADGDPSLGKSTVFLDWAARITRGHPLPNGPALAPRGVVVMSAEDDASDTIRPRADAAGADISRILILNERADGGLLSIPGDLALIEAEITRADAAFLIIDPLVAFLDGAVNINRDQDVRRALAPVRAMAERTGVAVLVIRHLNKMMTGNALYRGGGSIGVIGAARFGLTFAQDPDNEGRYLIASSKCNLGPKPETLAYRLVSVPGTDVARVEWDGTSALSANALLAASAGEDEERSALSEACAWLQDYLTIGARPAADVLKAARDADIAEKTLRRAKTRIGAQTDRKGFGPGSQVLWFLPDQPAYDPTIDGQDATASTGGHLCQVWENPRNDAEIRWPSMASSDGQVCEVGHLWEKGENRRNGAETVPPGGHQPSIDGQLHPIVGIDGQDSETGQVWPSPNGIGKAPTPSPSAGVTWEVL